MTIGYVLDDTLDKGDGVQQAMISIAEKMRELGHDVHYIVPYTVRTDLKNVHSLAKVVSLKFNGNSIRTPIWSSSRRIKKLFQDVEFDVLHVQMPYSPIMSAKVMKIAPSSTKIFGTFHILPYNNISRLGTRFLGFILRKSKRRFHQVFAVSAPALKFMKNDFGLDGSVIANPVDYEYFHAYAKKSRSIVVKRIVFLGRFDERKGVRQLVRAYEKLKNLDNTELIMCGKGPLLDELKKYSEDAGLKVNFTGYVTNEQKAEYLSSADIAVFPSTAGESFGIVLTEAMSAGASVTIGGNNPGYSSVLQQWPETIFDPNDIVSFTNKLQELIDDEKLLARLGSAQHDAVKQYDIRKIVDKLLNVYSQ